MNEHFKTFWFTLFLSAFTVEEVTCNFKLLLLHTNDMHSHYKEVNQDCTPCENSSDCYGGFARIHGAVKRFTEEAKNKGMPTVYLDAGDVFQGTVYYTEFKWKLAVKMMNLLKPQAMTLGNHEFDDGIEGLLPFVQGVEVPIVCCNLDTSKETRLKITKSVVITVGEAPNTAKIGIVGYMTRDVPQGKFGEVVILDEIQSLKAETKKLREEQKVDIIIALGQSGYEMDKKIARAVGEIDVIVGGHSHTFLYTGRSAFGNTVNGPYPTFVTPENNAKKRIPIVHAYYATKYLGYLELEWDSNWQLKNTRGLPVLLNGKIDQDKEVIEALKDDSDLIAKKYHYKIGSTEFTLQGRSNYCKLRECGMGNMITDAFVDYVSTNYKAENGKPVLIGLLHSAAIRGSLYGKLEKGHSGDITPEDVMTVLPYGNSLEVLEIKGQDLRVFLEETTQKFDFKKGNGGMNTADLMQVSGLRVKYDMTKWPGERVVSVKVAPEYNDLDKDSAYNVVVPDYVVNGKKYKILSIQKKVVSIKEEDKDYKVVEKFIQKQKVFKKGGKYSKPEGRISIRVYSWYEIYHIRIRNAIKNFFARLNPFNGLRG